MEINGINKETNVLQLHSMDGQGHPSSHMHHMDSSLIVFFKLEDLQMGNTMQVYFPKRDPSRSPHLLSKEKADAIPFSLEELPSLLKRFSFTQDSPQAKAMEDTLRQCKNKPIKGETKFCATSLESMLDFTRSIFGFDVDIKIVSTKHQTNSPTLIQDYTICQVPKEIISPKMVACHTMPYSYAIFYCHYQESKSRVFKVSLVGENGDRVEAIGVCHLDTSEWSHSHPSFQVLGIEPGTSPVCHYFPADNFVWVSSPAS